ncbi:MAG: phosphoribosylformylglycinamidine cyclo-ligase [Brasilonema octagenarum HA4186-MV1]|jgi:phosphoribosylformylglycinamidine cyclo-ligase|uniref:Phosphoribosylformylglycinamidine cyclo-ligase n=1 Tax=Brasilonema octagenarum UFV-OR1 TaxID=417115 RepID=A0ABX1M7W7_9CYAN|nr:phosphoribosylformylglycinamidine cyclo-ligase [Brasilonema octagenarum]MBW4626326.1 phosphoribosylformylglycinamidine cyclo-ligase [Brasilonema octagenarum HA4186-MV1]NMF64642.1 phosphoribosylformylglycinamidine cyclo-ligase [Brasilonema octagenarum UFV-OR1]
MDYKDAGVDVEAGREFVNQIRNLVHSTFRPEVIGGLGGFSGCFQLPSGYKEPVLVSGTDGVGTKLKIAHALNCHNSVGIDLVAMCVNDVLTSGAEPLFFLDYLATGQLEKEQLTQVVAGVASGCQQAGCALLGGETAEMPGFYQAGEYDLAGFCVGIVERSQMLDGSQVQVGDVAIALPSAGVHSNGFSLVRKIVSEKGFSWSDSLEIFAGKTLGEVFLSPTRIYVKPVLSARQAGLEIHGMAHITGGGLPENLPRCLGKNQAVQINSQSWCIPPVFQWLAETGSVSPQAMYNTFNMGVGFVLIVPPHQAEQVITYMKLQNVTAFTIGNVITGSGELIGLPI